MVIRHLAIGTLCFRQRPHQISFTISFSALHLKSVYLGFCYHFLTKNWAYQSHFISKNSKFIHHFIIFSDFCYFLNLKICLMHLDEMIAVSSPMEVIALKKVGYGLPIVLMLLSGI